MKQILSAGLVSCTLIALQGCHPDAVGHTVAVAGAVITSPRPDRLLNYEIEITTGVDTLTFKGSTPCDHRGGRYDTNNKYANLKKDGQEWILEGIDCNWGIQGREFGRYRLFKVKNDREAQLYFVTEGGKFRVTSAQFDSRATIGTSRVATLDKYNAGPYVYRKWIFRELPPTLGNLLDGAREPTIVRVVPACRDPRGQEPTLNLADIRRIIREENPRQRAERIEQGHLRRSSDGSGWELQRSDDVFVPLDVSTLARVGIDEDAQKRVRANCLRVFVDGFPNPFVVGISDYIYLPDEKALISMRTLSYPEQYSKGWLGF